MARIVLRRCFGPPAAKVPTVRAGTLQTLAERVDRRTWRHIINKYYHHTKFLSTAVCGLPISIRFTGAQKMHWGQLHCYCAGPGYSTGCVSSTDRLNAPNKPAAEAWHRRSECSITIISFLRCGGAGRKLCRCKPRYGGAQKMLLNRNLSEAHVKRPFGKRHFVAFTCLEVRSVLLHSTTRVCSQ